MEGFHVLHTIGVASQVPKTPLMSIIKSYQRLKIIEEMWAALYVSVVLVFAEGEEWKQLNFWY